MNDTAIHPLEEQAVDYVFGHMEAAERVAFVRAMEGDSALQLLVAELSESAAAMSLSLPQSAPPASAREHLLQRVQVIAQDRSTTVVAKPERKPMNITSLIGWGMAACFMVYTVARTNSHYVELQKVQDQLAAQEQRTNATLAELKQEAEAKNAVAEAATAALATARQTVEATKAELKAASEQSRSLLMQKDADYAKVVAERDSVAAERDKLATSQKMTNMQIATLKATIDDYKQGVAVVVWNAQKNEGILKLERMPAIPANKDFQLWVLDPAQKSPVSSGTVRVDEKGFARVEFKPSIDVTQADKFAISVEKKGGAASPEGPIVLLSN